jgi:hypothetical protein
LLTSSAMSLAFSSFPHMISTQFCNWYNWIIIKSLVLHLFDSNQGRTTVTMNFCLEVSYGSALNRHPPFNFVKPINNHHCSIFQLQFNYPNKFCLLKNYWNINYIVGIPFCLIWNSSELGVKVICFSLVFRATRGICHSVHCWNLDNYMFNCLPYKNNFNFVNLRPPFNFVRPINNHHCSIFQLQFNYILNKFCLLKNYWNINYILGIPFCLIWNSSELGVKVIYFSLVFRATRGIWHWAHQWNLDNYMFNCLPSKNNFNFVNLRPPFNFVRPINNHHCSIFQLQFNYPK